MFIEFLSIVEGGGTLDKRIPAVQFLRFPTKFTFLFLLIVEGGRTPDKRIPEGVF